MASPTSGNDILQGSAGNDSIDALAGDDTLLGEAGDDTLAGSDGSDLLDGSIGADRLLGGKGSNTFLGLADGHADTVVGGDGIDTAYYGLDHGAGVLFTVTASSGQQADGYGGQDQLGGVEQVHVAGTPHNDTLQGDGQSNLLQGRGGDDWLTGGGGADAFVYDLARSPDGTVPEGRDLITDLAHGDEIWLIDSSGPFSLSSYGSGAASPGTTLLRGQLDLSLPFTTAEGVVTELSVGVDATPGADLRIRFAGAIDLADFVFRGNTQSGVTLGYLPGLTLAGGPDGDYLSAGDLGDTLRGLGGDDTLLGWSGDDSLEGGSGADRLIGYDGSDTLVGGDGIDAFALGASPASPPDRDRVEDLERFERLSFGSVALYLLGEGNGSGLQQGEAAIGAYDPARNTTTVHVGADSLPGADLSVDLVGEFNAADFEIQTDFYASGLRYLPHVPATEGSDWLNGSVGSDTLAGLGGDDTLDGGAGNDSLDGGPGSDTVGFLDAATGVVVTLEAGTPSSDGQGGLDTLSGVENVLGTRWDDRISGDGGSNLLDGGAGNDTLAGGGGDDQLRGGTGTDTASYAGASSGVVAELWKALASSDGEGGSDVFTSIEILIGSAFGDLLAGSAGNDSLDAGAGNDSLYGGAGADSLAGGLGSDLLLGHAGNDTFLPSPGGLATIADFTPGAGGDMLDFSRFAPAGSAIGVPTLFYGGYIRFVDSEGDTQVQVDANGPGAGGFATVAVLRAVAADSLTSDNLGGYTPLVGTGDRMISGDGQNNWLHGLQGNDTVLGLAGFDTLNGGPGDDLLDGGEHLDTVSFAGATGALGGAVAELWKGLASKDGQGGSDLLVNVENLEGSGLGDLLAGNTGSNLLLGMDGADSLYGGAGDDTAEGGVGNDFIDGGDGIDTINYAGAGIFQGVVVELWRRQAGNDGQGGSDTLVDIDNVVGSNLPDLLAGDLGNNRLYGSRGEDSLYGGAGDDELWGGGGPDFIDGGAGWDRASYAAAPSGVRVELWAQRSGPTGAGGGSIWPDEEAGNDTLVGIEQVLGSKHDDLLAGSTGDDSLDGDEGNDALYGGAGQDSLAGSGGSDTLFGHGGADVFRFDSGSGGDRIADFNPGEGDRIQLVLHINGSGIADGESALAATTDSGGWAIIDLGGGHTLALVGISKASLSAGDFFFF